MLQAGLGTFLVREVKGIAGAAFQFQVTLFGAQSECQRSGVWALPFLPLSRCNQPCRGRARAVMNLTYVAPAEPPKGFLSGLV